MSNEGSTSETRIPISVVILTFGALGAAGFIALQMKTPKEEVPPASQGVAPAGVSVKDKTFKGKSLDEWIAALKDPNAEVRRGAATTLIEMDATENSTRSTELTRALLEQLKDDDSDARQLAAYVLGHIRAPSDAVIPALGAALRDRDQQTRRAAATALVRQGRRKPKSVDPLLRDALADNNPDVRRLAKYVQEQIKVTAVATRPAPPDRDAKTEDVKEPAKTEQTIVLGKLAPDIEGEDVHGRRFKLSDYRGKIVVLTFWAEY
jgi:HEAT repeat protein